METETEFQSPPPAPVSEDAAATPTVAEVQTCITQAVVALIAWVLTSQTLTFHEFETQLVPQVLALGRLFVQLFLCQREEQFRTAHPQVEPGYQRQGPIARQVGTLFGKVRYWRTYFFRPGGGYYPLDVELGLTSDGFSMAVRSCATRVATKVSYAQAVLLLTLFLHWSPAQGSLEGMVLGLGRHTGAWFAQATAPEGDGEVLVIQIDGKATPTATEAELEKRRGPRVPNPHPGSPRHRGRAARQRRGSRPRRQKGDKAKNGKMATIAVLYTLRRSADGTLEGPINKKVYASYAPKRHTVAIARREADKRGFGPGSGQRIQIVTDGDPDLERYIEEFFPAEAFPAAEHTIDVYHVVEYLWDAGACLYREGSAELTEWVEEQKWPCTRGEWRRLSPSWTIASPNWIPSRPASASGWRKSASISPSGKPKWTTCGCARKTWRSRRGPWKGPCATSSPNGLTAAGCAGSKNARRPCCSSAASR